MGQTLVQWTDRVSALLGAPSTAVLPPVDRDSAVFAAVRRYSKDRPRMTSTDYVGDGVTHTLAIPAGWVNGFSEVWEVEYPQGERPAVYLDIAEVTLYPAILVPTGIRLNLTTPGSGKTTRLVWTLPYPMPDATAATDLVPVTDFEPVASLAAAICAGQLQAEAADNQDPTVPSADFAGTESESGKWGERARKLMTVYLEHLGIEGGPPGASGILDWDAPSSWVPLGRKWLFRGRT
jgi:hypothetical protein